MNHFSAPTRRLPANLAYAVAAPLCGAVVVAIAAAIALAAGGAGDEAQINSAGAVAGSEPIATEACRANKMSRKQQGSHT